MALINEKFISAFCKHEQTSILKAAYLEGASFLSINSYQKSKIVIGKKDIPIIYNDTLDINFSTTKM